MACNVCHTCGEPLTALVEGGEPIYCRVCGVTRRYTSHGWQGHQYAIDSPCESARDLGLVEAVEDVDTSWIREAEAEWEETELAFLADHRGIAAFAAAGIFGLAPEESLTGLVLAAFFILLLLGLEWLGKKDPVKQEEETRE